MDASCKPDSLGFVTVPQLAEVFHSVGLRLSPVEIELLATGGSVGLLWCCLSLLDLLKVVLRTWLTAASLFLSAVNSSACSWNMNLWSFHCSYLKSVRAPLNTIHHCVPIQASPATARVA
jgi:hypothetical protein